MDENAKITELEKQVRMLTQRLDETRRMLGMSPIIDEQLEAIRARSVAAGRAA